MSRLIAIGDAAPSQPELPFPPAQPAADPPETPPAVQAVPLTSSVVEEAPPTSSGVEAADAEPDPPANADPLDRTWDRLMACRGWLEDAENDLNYPYHPQAGFIRIAFTHAFRLLIQGADFMNAMREVLSGGGDTDTNACIVGGLIGAADGCNAIPAGMAKVVIECDTSKGRHNRPSFLSGNHIPDLAVRLMLGGDCRGKVKA